MSKKKTYKVLAWSNMGTLPGYVMISCGYNYKQITRKLIKMKYRSWAKALSVHKEVINQSSQVACRAKNKSSKTGQVRHYYYIILQRKFKFTDEDYAMLAHEVLHICQFYLPDILNRDREVEAEAYLHTYLMKQCLKVLRGNK